MHPIRIGTAILLAAMWWTPAAAQIYGQGKSAPGQPQDQRKGGGGNQGQSGAVQPVPDRFQEGLRAYTRRDYQDALRAWVPMAQGGDGAAQYNIGRMYARGEGVRRDLAEAYMWFTIASRSGRAESDRAKRVIAQSMTPTQVAEGLRRAEKWRQQRRQP